MEFRRGDHVVAHYNDPTLLPYEHVKGHPNYRRLSDPAPGVNWGLIMMLGMNGTVWVGLAFAALRAMGKV